MGSYSTKKGLHFAFLQKSSKIKFLLTPRNMMLRGVCFYDTKVRITGSNDEVCQFVKQTFQAGKNMKDENLCFFLGVQ